MFFDTVSDLLKHRFNGQVHVVPPTSSVTDAVRLMNVHDIGAVLVTNGSGLEGILTERDVMARVIDRGLDPASTCVHQVMTARPNTIGPNERAARALDLMNKDGYRHVPVVDGNEVLGVLSMRDLNRWLIEELKAQADGALMAVKTMGWANRR